MKPTFRPGRNIAIKIPDHEFHRTLGFYRDVLGLPELTPPGDDQTPRFAFGDKVLWLDAVATLSQAEIWLEVEADNMAEAADWLAGQGCPRREGIEPLPADFRGFWVSSPCNIIHLVTEPETAITPPV